MKTYRANNDIGVYRYGNPIKTGSVVADIESFDLKKELDIKIVDGRALIDINLHNEDSIYGLGANMGGINKRGRKYESYCTDEPLHIEDRKTLYAAHNFFMISGKELKGYFIDFPTRIKYDIGYTDRELFNIEIFGEDFDIYIIDGKDENDIVSKFLRLIGRTYIPPKWAFGYFQSRWGYRNKDEVREINYKFRKNRIPLEGIFLDLDYMEDFKDFSLSDERFSNFPEFVRDMKEEGTRLIPIIDAGVKVEEGYDIYEEGIEGNHFCKDENGDPYTAVVWPGNVHFPDFLKEDTQRWFGSKYKILTDAGIEGVWNDMNEPAIFYEPKHLDEAIDFANKRRGQNLDALEYFELKDKFTELANKDEYYQSFYHDVDGKRMSNDEVHNLYGYLMTKSANIGLKENLKDRRFLLISRASSIGMHRYGGVWTGDNSSWWSQLDQNIKMMPSLNMAGFLYSGADIGGFGGNCNGEMLVRWLQFGIFVPFLRNHTAIGSAWQEPFAFTDEVMEDSKRIIETRYRLIPYIYSEFMKAARKFDTIFKPLSFEYEGNLARQAEDQLLFSKELMLAPVYHSNHRGRYVYVPEKMLEISFLEEDYPMSLREEGIHYLDYDLDDIKFYLRKNSMLPVVDSAERVEELDLETLKILAYVEDRAEYNMYDDDGESYDYMENKYFNTRIRISSIGDDFKIEVDNNNPSIKTIDFVIIGQDGNRVSKSITV